MARILDDPIRSQSERLDLPKYFILPNDNKLSLFGAASNLKRREFSDIILPWYFSGSHFDTFIMNCTVFILE